MCGAWSNLHVCDDAICVFTGSFCFNRYPPVNFCNMSSQIKKPTLSSDLSTKTSFSKLSTANTSSLLTGKSLGVGTNSTLGRQPTETTLSGSTLKGGVGYKSNKLTTLSTDLRSSTATTSKKTLLTQKSDKPAQSASTSAGSTFHTASHAKSRKLEETDGSHKIEKVAKLSVGSSVTKPSVGSSATKPSVGSSATTLSVGSSATTLSVGSSATKPSVGSSATKPSIGSSATKPSVDSSATKPSVGSSATKPSIDSSAIFQSAMIAKGALLTSGSSKSFSLKTSLMSQKTSSLLTSATKRPLSSSGGPGKLPTAKVPYPTTTTTGPDRRLLAKQPGKIASQVEDTLTAQSEMAKRASETLPHYGLRSTVVQKDQSMFVPPEKDTSVVGLPVSPVDVASLKTSFIHAVSASLLSAPDFHDRKHPTFKALHDRGFQVAQYDAEFLLKAALYTRCELNIRTTANFLLALAANLHNCRPHIGKYFSASIRLPSDWIEVAEIYQAFHDKSINYGSLPTALRKAMVARFPDFDEYQLAKYNKEKSHKKKKEPQKADNSKKSIIVESNESESENSFMSDSDSESEEELERLSFTLKQLIRKLHIVKPVNHVMCILGKRYPEDPEAYRRSHLPGMWDQDQAGKRMKLKVPETWETQVSLKGNKATVWEELIDHRKLPFMAMLRNLRNLIISGISPAHHHRIIRKLKDEYSVVGSRQFPFRFFSAFEVLSELEKIAKGQLSEDHSSMSKATRIRKKSEKKKKKNISIKDKLDLGLLSQYKNALDTALKIATCYNVKPIPGTTLIVCNVGISMKRPCTSARGLGKPRTVQEVGILLSLMCKFSCEHSTMWIYGHGISKYHEIQLQDGTILHNMDHVLAMVTQHYLDYGDGELPKDILEEYLIKHTHIDNLLILSDTVKSNSTDGAFLSGFLKKYRRFVNPDLLFVNVDLSGKSVGFSDSVTPGHENDIYLAGFSDQILRFIAERGDDSQLTHVQNIDKAYNLKAVKRIGLQPTSDGGVAPSLAKEKAFLASGQSRIWRTIRVFISSTFKDMHGERDLLTRYVFPELRARAHQHHIQLYEVDLRWGVTEEDTKSAKALEICLEEINRCHYFIGLLGQRYGWAMDEYPVPDMAEFDWLKEYPPGRSITELEIYHAALADPEKAQNKAFFFLRDPAFLEEVPSEVKSSFVAESFATDKKIESLKSRLRTSGLEVYDKYSARWLGVIEGKPMTGNLDDFGKRVLDVLWNRIQKDFPKEDPESDPLQRAYILHSAFAQSESEKFVGRQKLVKQAISLVGDGKNRLIVGVGKPGSGKSAFMSAFLHQYSEILELREIKPDTRTFVHFIGAMPESGNLENILTRICHDLKKKFSLTLNIPQDFSELLLAWPEFLNETSEILSGRGKFLILIDGLDLLEEVHGGRSLEWIPTHIPENITIFVSCREGLSPHMILAQRGPPPTVMTIGALDIFDKAEMVRRRLGKHKKRLDESAFNNQMKLLLSKKDAVSPLYLHLACEELRVFGVFEEVSSKLHQMSPTISGLLQEILHRLEMEHGQELVCTALSFLAIAQNGLTEAELSSLLGIYTTAEVVQQSGLQKVPPMTVAKLFRSLQGYLQPTSHDSSDLLIFSHQDIETAVRKNYLKGRNSDLEKVLHTVAALYFRSQADPGNNGLFEGTNPRAVSELPYHLKNAGMWEGLADLLTNLYFIKSKAQLGLSHRLLEDYTLNINSLSVNASREAKKFIETPSVEAFHSFLSRNLHIVSVTPALVLQQALNEPSQSIVTQTAKSLIQGTHPSIVECVNKKEDEDACQLTITGGLQSVLSVAVSKHGNLVACGMKNCIAKVYNILTGVEVATFTGHAGAITGLTFVGNGRLCTASKDCMLSLWDVKNGHRIEVMKGHTKPVQDCVANDSGKRLVSVSYDGSARVWNGEDGKQVSLLRTQNMNNRPINCVSFHPEGQLVALGGWDTHIKIWDTFKENRLKVLRGHKTSVQACSYSPTGRHIASASLDGEVKLWSVKSGTALGSLPGHCKPVRSLAFSGEGLQLFTASKDNTVKTWSGTLGMKIMSQGNKEFGKALCIGLTPEAHEKPNTLVVGYHSGFVRQFELASPKPSLEIRIHEGPVTAVCLKSHQDSNSIFCLTTSVDNLGKVWLLVDPEKCVILAGHSEPIRCALWSDNLLATGSEDLTVRIWPHLTNKFAASFMKVKSFEPVATLRGHRGPVTSLALIKSSGTLVSSSQDRSLMFWDIINHVLLKTLPACHKDWINAISMSNLSPDYLITASSDFNLKLWDLKKETEKTLFTGHTSAISCLDFQEGCVVSGAVDGSLKVWTHKGFEITTLNAHKSRVNACILHMPGMKDAPPNWADVMDSEETSSSTTKKLKPLLKQIVVIAASDDGTVTSWKPFIASHEDTLIGHSHEVQDVAITNEDQIVTGSADKTLKIWKYVNKSTSSQLTHNGPVTAVAVNPSGSLVVSTSRDGTGILWEVKTVDDQLTVTPVHQWAIVKEEDAVIDVKFIGKLRFATCTVSPSAIQIWTMKSTSQPILACSKIMKNFKVSKLQTSGEALFAVTLSGQLVFINTSTLTGIQQPVKLHDDWIVDAVVVGDGIASIGLDNNLVKSCPSKIGFSSIALVPNESIQGTPWVTSITSFGLGKYIAVGDSGGHIRVFIAESSSLKLTKKIHGDAVNCLMNLKEMIVVSGSSDGTIKIWKIEVDEQQYVCPGKSGAMQIGQFHSTSSVTCLSRLGNQENIFLAGNQLGQVNVLKFWK